MEKEPKNAWAYDEVIITLLTSLTIWTFVSWSVKYLSTIRQQDNT